MPLSSLEPGPGYRTQRRGLEELEGSVPQFGVISPLWVQPHSHINNTYVIFADAGGTNRRGGSPVSDATPPSKRPSRSRPADVSSHAASFATWPRFTSPC